jgi:hypothetical protein
MLGLSLLCVTVSIHGPSILGMLFRSKGDQTRLKSRVPNGLLERKPSPTQSLGSVEYRIRWGEHAGRKKCGIVNSDGGIETKEGLYFSSIGSWVRSGPFQARWT